jgi:hypothetical protein
MSDDNRKRKEKNEYPKNGSRLSVYFCFCVLAALTPKKEHQAHYFGFKFEPR